MKPYCQVCKGTSHRPNDKTKSCTHCNGSGMEQHKFCPKCKCKPGVYQKCKACNRTGFKQPIKIILQGDNAMTYVGANVLLMLMGETLKFNRGGIKYTIKREYETVTRR